MNSKTKVDGCDHIVIFLKKDQSANCSESYDSHTMHIPNHGTDTHEFAAKQLRIDKAQIVLLLPTVGTAAFRNRLSQHLFNRV